MIFYNVYLQIAIVMKLYSTQCTLGNFDDFFFRTICKVACKVVGDEKNLLAEGSSKEACERIRSFSSLPIVKVNL